MPIFEIQENIFFLQTLLQSCTKLILTCIIFTKNVVLGTFGKTLYFSKSGKKMVDFPKMPYFQAVTNHTKGSQKIKVMGVL